MEQIPHNMGARLNSVEQKKRLILKDKLLLEQIPRSQMYSWLLTLKRISLQLCNHSHHMIDSYINDEQEWLNFV